MKKILLVLLVAFLQSVGAYATSVGGVLKNGSTPVPYGKLQLNLMNCPAPTIVNARSTPVTSYVLFADTHGVLAAQAVTGNDQISCGGVVNHTYYLATLRDVNGNVIWSSPYQLEGATWVADAAAVLNPIPSVYLSAQWGGMVGNINDQTDLINLLNTVSAGGFTVNGSTVPGANFSSSAPAPDSGFVRCTYKVSTVNVISECPIGTSSSTFAAGNDSRITGAEQTSNKDVDSGYAGLDSGGKLKTSEAPTWNQNTTGAAAGLSANIAESQVTSLTTDLGLRVLTTTTVNGHTLSSSVVISAADITTGTLPHGQLPSLLSGDIPNNAANTSGTAGGLSAAISESLVTSLSTDLTNRAVISSLQIQGYTLATDTGSANAYAACPSPSPTLSEGSRFQFKAVHANTGSSTFAVCGGSALTIKKQSGGANLANGDIPIGAEVDLTYMASGTYFQCNYGCSGNASGSGNVSGSGTSASNDVAAFNNTTTTGITDPGNLRMISTNLIEGPSITAAYTLQAGPTATVAGTAGPLILTGTPVNSTPTTSATAGAIMAMGANNASVGASGNSIGGAAYYGAGGNTGIASNNNVPGYDHYTSVYRAGTTVTAGRLACDDGHNTVEVCTSASQIPVGVFPASDSTSSTGFTNPNGGAAWVQWGGSLDQVSSEASEAFVNGDILCSDPAFPGYVKDNGTTMCSCAGPSYMMGVARLTGTFAVTTMQIILGGCTNTAGTSLTNSSSVVVTSATGNDTNVPTSSGTFTAGHSIEGEANGGLHDSGRGTYGVIYDSGDVTVTTTSGMSTGCIVADTFNIELPGASTAYDCRIEEVAQTTASVGCATQSLLAADLLYTDAYTTVGAITAPMLAYTSVATLITSTFQSSTSETTAQVWRGVTLPVYSVASTQVSWCASMSTVPVTCSTYPVYKIRVKCTK